MKTANLGPNPTAYTSVPGGLVAVENPGRFPCRWVFDNKVMTTVEFANAVYGDSPQRTQFLLKYGEYRG